MDRNKLRVLNGVAMAALWVAIVVPTLIGDGYHPFGLEVAFCAVLFAAAAFLVGFVLPLRPYAILFAFSIYWLVDAYYLTITEKTEFYYLGGIILFLVAAAVFYKVFRAGLLQLAVILFSVVFLVPSFADFPDPVLVAEDVVGLGHVLELALLGLVAAGLFDRWARMDGENLEAWLRAN